jgi:hypothetical protein
MRRTMAVLMAVATVLTACSSATTRDVSRLGHIHGIGVDPADQTLYAATHYGLYRVTGQDEPELVGGIVQDFMGFTVVGPNHFLGSGHPNENDHNQPSSLGLIESTDAGRSWNSLSLNGEADFHSIEYRHNRVYAYDSHSQRVLVSADKQQRDRRATIRDFDMVVSPLSPNEILATTPDGLLRSRDQAATFVQVDSAPPLVFLSWPDRGPLVGIDPGGTVYVSNDSGDVWTARRAFGERPQALSTADSGQLFVATDHAIYRSSDGGANFESFRRLDPP